MTSSLLFILAAPALLAHAARQIKVTNNCPSSINVFMNGNSQGYLDSGASTSSWVPNSFSGFIYTNANGGSQSGAGTTRAGFYGPNGYYYLVTDPKNFNTGVTISPNRGPVGPGFCVPATCNALSCSTAFTSPPTAFPPSKNVAPNVPLYSCPDGINNVGYTVTFCPNGYFPPVLPPRPPPSQKGTALHPNGNNNKCLDVRGAKFANGTPVQIYDCNGTNAQKWIINDANTKVRVAGTNFCLDAGTNPASGVGMKIWQCYAGLAQQAWYYTEDKRIAVAGQGQCLDLTNGVLTNGNQVQTWKCTNKDVYQIWTE
ncbi:Extracellular exo-alpha-L-arabinofuranosidase [Hypsizygus marmoreus]|uniref:Extracellular exo-alpha-L-arabinofuranosidase n=1 Tax=Hypsizygus marmoreus TaxID=39966 RepID=A0A369JZN1_HYPMA|nr:Extracellular exo-alpha-L-arabinofuranosidase [Hypsizygus marmoreus]